MGNVVAAIEDTPTRTFVIKAQKPELNGLRVTVKPNGGTIMREVGRLAKKRRIVIDYTKLDPEGAYENALMTSEVLVVSLERVRLDEKGEPTDEVVETIVAPGGAKSALRAILEKFDTFAREIRSQAEELNDEVEGKMEGTARD